MATERGVGRVLSRFLLWCWDWATLLTVWVAGMALVTSGYLRGGWVMLGAVVGIGASAVDLWRQDRMDERDRMDQRDANMEGES